MESKPRPRRDQYKGWKTICTPRVHHQFIPTSHWLIHHYRLTFVISLHSKRGGWWWNQFLPPQSSSAMQKESLIVSPLAPAPNSRGGTDCPAWVRCPQLSTLRGSDSQGYEVYGREQEFIFYFFHFSITVDMPYYISLRCTKGYVV